MTTHRRPIWKRPLLLLLLLALGLAGTAAFQSAWRWGCKMASANGLQQIKLALENYRQANGCYPPQYLADKNGRPMHSWRVLIWPYLAGDESCRRYRFDEPWNGPHNRLLASQAPACFRSPNGDRNSKSPTTDYVAIVGKDTLWRGAVPLRPSDLERIQKHFWKEETAGLDPDKRTRIVWFVEAANTGINWMEPRDVPLEQALVGVNVAGGIQSDYSDGLPAQLMPYGCDWVPVGTPREAFRQMLTLSDPKD